MQDGPQAGRWRSRRPRWLQVERAHMELLRRAAAAGHDPATSLARPAAPLSEVPPVFKVGAASLRRFGCDGSAG